MCRKPRPLRQCTSWPTTSFSLTKAWAKIPARVVSKKNAPVTRASRSGDVSPGRSVWTAGLNRVATEVLMSCLLE